MINLKYTLTESLLLLFLNGSIDDARYTKSIVLCLLSCFSLIQIFISSSIAWSIDPSLGWLIWPRTHLSIDLLMDCWDSEMVSLGLLSSLSSSKIWVITTGTWSWNPCYCWLFWPSTELSSHLLLLLLFLHSSINNIWNTKSIVLCLLSSLCFIQFFIISTIPWSIDPSLSWLIWPSTLLSNHLRFLMNRWNSETKGLFLLSSFCSGENWVISTGTRSWNPSYCWLFWPSSRASCSE